ncbi:MAG: hypothetical protein DMG76_12685 [Acidobacteria bacterium]|nr:MAG: hypothetical protein DMG76_12685 [Acidobacteriota bacterium]
MHAFLECGPPGGSFTGMVDQLESDGAITAMTTLARKYIGLWSQPGDAGVPPALFFRDRHRDTSF